MKPKTIRTYVGLIIFSGIFIRCGGRPISMAHFMSDNNSAYLSYQSVQGKILDEETENNDGVYHRKFEFSWNALGGIMGNVENSPIHLGFQLGFNGLSPEIGFKSGAFGILGWASATYGFPCYGIQSGYSLINNDVIKVGPVVYYSRNSYMNTTGEYGSFPTMEQGTAYSESGTGLYTILSVSENFVFGIDYKYGINWEENRNKHYFEFTIQTPIK